MRQVGIIHNEMTGDDIDNGNGPNKIQDRSCDASSMPPRPTSANATSITVGGRCRDRIYHWGYKVQELVKIGAKARRCGIGANLHDPFPGGRLFRHWRISPQASRIVGMVGG